MKTLRAYSLLTLLTSMHAYAANLTPWKVTVLNGFPEVAEKMTAQTKSTLLILEKLKPSEKDKKKLSGQIAEVEALVTDAKGKLIEHSLSPDLFDEVDLDLIAVKHHIKKNEFKAAADILRVYEDALGTFVFVK